MQHAVRSRAAIRTGLTPVPRPRTPGVTSLIDTDALRVLHRAARALLDDLPDLTDRLVALLEEQEPAYRAAVTKDPTATWQEAHRSLRHSVASLLDPRGARDAARRCSWRIGAARAEQGLPLDALLHAFRLGGSLVWQRLVEETSRAAPRTCGSSCTWPPTCGTSSTSTAPSSRTPTGRPSGRSAGAARTGPGCWRQACSTAPAASPTCPKPPGHSTCRNRAATSSSRSPADPRPAPTPPAPTPSAPPPYRPAPASTGTPGPRSTTASSWSVAAKGSRKRRRPGPVPRPLPGLRIGIGSPVAGLAAVGEARRLADTALGICPAAGGTVRLADQLPAALVVSSPELGRALAEKVLGPLLRLEPADREVLLDTLTTWLECDGSAQRAGERLYCHRNTVLNRLRRCEQLTGRSLARPADVVEFSLALTARRVLRD